MTGERVQSGTNPAVTPDMTSDAWKAAIHAKMLETPTSYALQYKDEIDQQMRLRSPNYDDGKIDDTLANDFRTGYESSVLGLTERLVNKQGLPQQVRNPGMVDKFVSGVGQFLGDVPAMLTGALLGGAAGSEVPIVGNAVGAGAGAFALPAAARDALIQGITKGDVTSFSDILRRMASMATAGAKGAVVGAATEAAGGIPVGGFIGKSAIASAGVKGIYQATALTTTADLMEGRLPTKEDFAGNAALIIPLNLITHGVPLRGEDANRALMDVYAKDGKTPADSVETLNAQPPVKPDLPEGLRPAIQTPDGHISGEADESHDDVAERVTGTKPVTMEQLEADPAKADSVLENPIPHDQEVIDRAIQLKTETIEAGDVKAPEGEEKPLTFDDLYDRASLKSGRGFETPDGEFITRSEGTQWMKKNEPDVHEMWLDEVEGDKQASLRSSDYGIARMRVSGRNVAEGDPVVDNLPPDIKRMLAEARSETGILNKVKAGLKSVKYGFESVRTLLTGPRDYFRAEGNQIISRLRELVPDKTEQEALHFARDYRGEEDLLRKDIEEVRSGDNEKLKAFLPAMERGLEPMSPAMAQADGQMTQYFKSQLERGRALGTLDSAVDPSRYSPRFFMRAMEEAQTTGVGRPRFTDKTVNSLRREYLHTLDPLQSGDTEARTFNAFDEMGVYNDRMAIANSTALFIRELKNTALGVVSSGNKVPANWVRLTKQFEDRRTFVQDDGSSVTTVKNLYVPKDIADALQPLLEEGGTPARIAKFLHLQSVIKGIELSLSAFHIKALNVTAFNNLGFRDFINAWHTDMDAPDNEAIERRGALHGLTTTKTGVPFESYKGLQPVAEQSGYLAGLKDNAVVEGANKFMEGTSRYIFDTVQRRWKVMDWAKKEAGWIAKNPDATESEYTAAMRGYAKEVNAAYGGLNWDVMGVSKGMQNIARLFLLAPDWTFSNVVNLKYAVSDSGTAGKASRALFAKSFITGIAATAAMSIYVGGKYDPKHFDQVYLGTDKDGKEMYSNIFFAGAPKDLMSLAKRSYNTDPVTGLAETVIGKASPILGATIDLGKNEDFRGRPISKPGDSGAMRTVESTLYVGEKVIPITGETPVEMMKSFLTQPDYSPSYQEAIDFAAGLVGSPIYHEGEGGTRKSAPMPGAGKSPVPSGKNSDYDPLKLRGK